MSKSYSIPLVVIFLVAGRVFGQQQLIVGKTIDSLSRQPLAFVSIMVLSPGKKQIASSVSDDAGSFSIKVDKADEAASIVFSYLQYADRIIQIINAEEAKRVDLGKVLMQGMIDSLQQVTVSGKKLPVSLRFDRQVFNASSYQQATGGSGIDIIRNLPSISVDAFGAISFRGSSSFLLLVNGKTVQGEPATIIGQMPAGSIESIELITNPSAAYDADGRAGIINIVTKTATQDGWVLQGTVLGGLPALNDFDNDRVARRYSSELSVGYQKNRFDLSGNINYQRNDQNGHREGDIYTLVSNFRTEFPSDGERSFKKYNYGIRLAAVYAINKNNSLRSGFYWGKRLQIRDANLFYENKHINLSDGTVSLFNYYNANRQQKEGEFTLANLEWQHAFDNKSKLTITGLYERAALTSLTTNLNAPKKNSRDTLEYTENPGTNPLNAFRLKADYEFSNWSAGYQFRIDVQDGNFLYLTKIPGSNDFVIDPEFTSNVKTENLIHAGYLQYSSKFEAMEYSAGLRVETTNRTLQFSKDNETRTLNLINFFPNAQLRYSFSNSWKLKAGFSRRIRRTNNFELNPFPEREHSETLEQGDPDLLPELIFTLDAGAEHKYKKGNLFITPYFQSVKNPIQRTNKVYNDTILNRVFTNGDRAIQLGIEVSNTHNFFPWWQSIVGGNFYWYKINGNLFGNTIVADNRAWVFAINLTQSFNLGKNWGSQIALNYLSDRPTLQGEDSYFLNPAISVRKQSQDRRWTFQAQCQFLDLGWDASNKQRITTKGADFFTTTNYIYEVNQILFSISYRLDKKNRKINVPVSEIGEKEF